MTNKKRQPTRGRVIDVVLKVLKKEKRMIDIGELSALCKYPRASTLASCRQAELVGKLVCDTQGLFGKRPLISFGLATQFSVDMFTKHVKKEKKEAEEKPFINKTLISAHKAFAVVVNNHKFHKVNINYV